jgi:dTDP-4-amino-4,6-dideoxygalactose transaminase
MGKTTEEFEERFSKMLGVRYAFAVSSGTAALHLAHLALGIGKADEVICPSLTFVAVSNSILYTGAKPVFADIYSKRELTISPPDIKRKVTSKTKAITVMHYGGYPCRMDEIMTIAKEKKLKVIEDCAHAPLGEYKEKKLGTIGDVGCFSFFPNKNMTTGEGGMVITNDKSLAQRIRLMRSHGMTAISWDKYKGHSYSYDVASIGFNYRIDEIRSALGISQLSRLKYNNEKRKKLTEMYQNNLKDINELIIPFKNFTGKSSYHLFAIILNSTRITRNKFIEKLMKGGIQASIHYPPVHLFSYYRKKFGYNRGDLPLTEETSQGLVTLPLHPLLKRKDIEYIVSKVRIILQGGV